VVRPTSDWKEGDIHATNERRQRTVDAECSGSRHSYGDKVINRQKEGLGTIEHLMIDEEKGRVAYAVLSFGGFLGMGDKLFAIPWSALAVDTEERQFILDVDKKLLEHAPGFDKAHSPNIGRPRLGCRSFHLLRREALLDVVNSNREETDEAEHKRSD
jgi:PRC-barrel domain